MFWLTYNSKNNEDQNVGAGLPAMATSQSMILQMSHRYRMQASNHTGSGMTTELAPGRDRCGSGLAREG
ncbi:hypothetical protein, partial [Pseudomonas paracarnis]|uniref:hypothetical protein n=1 Tax=Pseudomonas paracarnis TaxID=2750625 RepID=UPI002939185D